MVSQNNNSSRSQIVSLSRSSRKYKIALAVLSVALLSTLVCIAYMMMVGKESKEQINSNGGSKSVAISSAAKTDKPQMKEICGTNEKLCIKYPDNWKAEAEDAVHSVGDQSNGVYHADKITLTHSNGLKLAFASGLSSLGGACTEEDNNLSVEIVRKDMTNLKGYQAYVPAEYSTYTNDSAFALGVIVPNTDGTKFTPEIGLSTANKLINNNQAKVCDVKMLGVINAKNTNITTKSSGSPDHGQLFIGTKEFSGYTASFQNKSYNTREEARKAFEGEDYKQAYEIIRSVYYK